MGKDDLHVGEIDRDVVPAVRNDDRRLQQGGEPGLHRRRRFDGCPARSGPAKRCAQLPSPGADIDQIVDPRRDIEVYLEFAAVRHVRIAHVLETHIHADFASGTRVLMNRNVDAAVIENDSGVILGQGLAYDRCQVGVITNIDPDRHTGRYYIETPEQVYNVLRTQVDLVLPTGVAVLNAKEPMLVEMVPLCDGEVIFFALDPDLPAISSHREQGKRAVIVRYGQIMLASGEGEIALAKLADIPLTEGGKSTQQIENVLAAVGAAWALGISPDVMRTGIETFFVD